MSSIEKKMKIPFIKKSVTIYNRSCIYLLIVLIFSFSFEAFGRINLPQISKRIQIRKNTHSLLLEYFQKIEVKPNAILEEKIACVLLDYLKDNYRSACIGMISHWGSLADGTAQLKLRVLFNCKQSSTRLILLGLRCYSKYREYGEKFYDERLVILLIHAQESEMILMPHAEDCTNCPELSKIKFNQVVQNNSKPLVLSLSISLSNDNPCCDGSYQYEEEKINYYALLKTGLKQVASITHYRDEYFHDDVEGNTNIIFNSTIKTEIDQENNFVQIISEYKLRVNGVEKESGTRYYKWDPEKEIFGLKEK